MPLPKVVLVPTDFSESSDAALSYAMSIAAATIGGRIVLLHAYATPVVAFPTGAMAYVPEIISNIVRQAEDELLKRAERVKGAGVAVETSLKNGDPRDSVLLAIDEFHADMVCMGTRGRRGIAHMLIGSVAESVVRTSKVPVLTVHRPAT